MLKTQIKFISLYLICFTLLTLVACTSSISTEPTTSVNLASVTNTPIPTPLASTLPISQEEHIQINYILFLSKEEEGGNQGKIIEYNIPGKTWDIVTENTNKFSYGYGNYSHNGNYITIVQKDIDTNQFKLNIFDRINKTNILLDLAKPNIELDNLSGVIPFNWSYNDEWFAYAYLSKDYLQEVYLINIKTKENTNINLQNSTWFNWGQNSLQFAVNSPDNKIYYGQIPLQELKISDYKETITSFVWHPLKSKLLLRTFKDYTGEINLQELDLNSNKSHTIVSHLNIDLFNYSPNGEKVVFNTRFKNELFIFDIPSSKIIETITLPKDIIFYELVWQDNYLVLRSENNFYIIPENESKGYWLIDEDSDLYNTFSNLFIYDWHIGK